MYEFFPWLIDMSLFETSFTEQELQPVIEVLKSGKIGFGPNVVEFENKFSQYSNKKYNIATNSASAAAWMIFAFLAKKYGECEIYTTSLGFVSPAWSAKKNGHEIIYVDVDDNLLFSVENYLKVRRNNNKTKVVMPILYGGVSNIRNSNMIPDNDIRVVDSAHCVTPTIDCEYSFFSFHPYKPIAMSDGGMIATDDSEATKYFRAYRNFGRQSLKNYALPYDIDTDGFKFYMNNLNATIGLAQIERYAEMQKRRKTKHEFFAQMISKKILQHDKDSSYYFGTVFADNANAICEKYKLPRHYPMLHKTVKHKNGQVLTNTEFIFDKIINIPIHENIDSNFLLRLANDIEGR